MSFVSSGRTEPRAPRVITVLAIALAAGTALAQSPVADPEAPAAEVLKAEGQSVLLPLKGPGVELKAGMKPRAGERIRTSASSEVVLRYPDGSEVALGKNSEIGFLKTGGGSQRLLLRDGSLRGLIAKKAQQGGKPSYYFRTRSAVMGVRGTDFVYSFDQGSSRADIHTLEGEVEVAKEEATIEQAKGTRVAESQKLTVDLKGFSKVERFEKHQYLAQLQEQDPSLATVTEEVVVKDTPWVDSWGLSLLRFQAALIKTNPREATPNLPLGAEIAWTPQFRIFRFLAIRAQAGVLFGEFERFTDDGTGPRASMRQSFFLTGVLSADLTIWKGLTFSPHFGYYSLLNVETTDVFGTPVETGVPVSGSSIAWLFGPASPIDRIFVGLVIGMSSDAEVTNPDFNSSFDLIRLGVGFRL